MPGLVIPTTQPSLTDIAPAQDVRCAIYNAATTVGWVKIPGATGTGSHSHLHCRNYNEQDGRKRSTDDATDNVETWSGGGCVWNDDGTTRIDADSDVGRCLRAAVTYRDPINTDRTYADADPFPNDNFDPTFEGTYKGTEYAVKALDDENDAPKFTDDGLDSGENVNTYRAERRENATGTADFTPPDIPTLRIIEAFDAVDVEANEDDDADDILTYTLSGRDAGSFKITGSVDNPGSNLARRRWRADSQRRFRPRGPARIPRDHNRHRPKG